MSVSGQFFRYPHHLRILGYCKAQTSPFFAIGISGPSHIFIPRMIALRLIVVYVLFICSASSVPSHRFWRYRSGTIIWVVGQIYCPLPPLTSQTCSHIPFDCWIFLFCWLWVPWGYVMTINPPKSENLIRGLKRGKLMHKGPWSHTPGKTFIHRPP